MTDEDYTIEELLQMIKSSDDSKKFIFLLQKISDNVANVRMKLPGMTVDNLELRCGIVKVIDDMLLKPLTKNTTQQPHPEPTRYS